MILLSTEEIKKKINFVTWKKKTIHKNLKLIYQLRRKIQLRYLTKSNKIKLYTQN